MTAVGRTWHPEHFCCVFCHRQLTENDDFHEKDGIIVCRSVKQVQLVIRRLLCSVVPNCEHIYTTVLTPLPPIDNI